MVWFTFLRWPWNAQTWKRELSELFWRLPALVLAWLLAYLIFSDRKCICSVASSSSLSVVADLFCKLFLTYAFPEPLDRSFETIEDVDQALAWNLRDYLAGKVVPSMMVTLAVEARIYLMLYKIQRDRENGGELSSEVSQYVNHLIRSIEKQTFPWLNGTVKQLHNSFKGKGRGIVYTFRKSDSYRAFLSILGLRHIGCQLPIHIMYYGEESLPSPYRKRLEGLPGVTSLDMTNLFLWEHSKPDGFAWKPFAVLYAPFEEVIFLDSDVTFFKRPEVLFDDYAYKETGTLFFHDRSSFWNPYRFDPASWIPTFIPTLSSYAKSLRVMRGYTLHEQESGVLVINKTTSSNAMLALLFSCNMNIFALKEEVWKHVWGDKETFWIAYEMMSEPYAFMPSYGGVIGSLSKLWYPGKAVCGGLSHIDRDRRPLWLNGGIRINKYSTQKIYLRFEHYRADDTAKGLKWYFDPDSFEGECMVQIKSSTEIEDAIPFTKEETEVGSWLVERAKYYQNDPDYSDFWKSLY